jgi:hypothetical protein
MNIKIRKYQLYVVAFVALGLGGLLANSPPVIAATSTPFDYCKQVAPKVSSDTCLLASGQAVNAANQPKHCKDSKDKPKCREDKAKEYLKAAAAGNPGDAKFKSQLSDAIGKDNGDKNTPNANGEVTTGQVSSSSSFFGTAGGTHPCGNLDKAEDNVQTKFDFGCLGPKGPKNLNPIMDLLFAFIRFLSVGVGLVVVASIILAGIQYSTSEGNPETTQAAKNRVRDAVIGLIIYLFAFSLVQYLVPGGLF